MKRMLHLVLFVGLLSLLSVAGLQGQTDDSVVCPTFQRQAFNGFSMANTVKRGDQDASAAQIEGVPSLAVDGKYLVNSKAAGSYEDLLRITETVIAKARQDRKGK